MFNIRAFLINLAFSVLTVGPLLAADLPVKHVILYKHGIGFFERAGMIAAGDESHLEFKSSEMNDVLKSLTVTDSAGGRVTGIRYDSNETLEQQLAEYSINIGDKEPLSTFIDRNKGARIEAKQGDRTIAGSIVSARAVRSGGESENKIISEQVTLLLDSGDLVNLDLATISSLRLLDPRLQEQLKKYLQTLAAGKSRQKRSVYIDSLGSAARNLRVSYITPTAIWKSSYRLTLRPADSTLEGWAIVDNTTDEDWNNVQLSVVSGRPISFISLLDTPRFGQRQVAELPEDRAAGPVVYGGALDQKVINGSVDGRGVSSGARTGAGLYRIAPPPPAMLPSAGLTNESVQVQAQASSVEGATGATLGELFEYNFADPVTIKKNQSAMLPFLQDKVLARKLLIYGNQDSEHPVNAAEVTNATGKTLDGGPITVYDGGAYAGEALFETLKDSDKRLIGYAVDYGTRITTAFDSGEQNLRTIHIRNGMLEMSFVNRETRTYNIKNVDAQAKTLVIEQPALGDYTLVSPKPMERTSKAYRFEVKTPANDSTSMKIEQERTSVNVTSVSDATPDFLLTIVSNKQVSEKARTQLKAISTLKQNIVQAQADLAAATSLTNDVNSDQSRLRQNIDSLNRVKGQEDQVRTYSGQLGANEIELSKLRDQTRELSRRKEALQSELRNSVNQLDF